MGGEVISHSLSPHLTEEKTEASRGQASSTFYPLTPKAGNFLAHCACRPDSTLLCPSPFPGQSLKKQCNLMTSTKIYIFFPLRQGWGTSGAIPKPSSITSSSDPPPIWPTKSLTIIQALPCTKHDAHNPHQPPFFTDISWAKPPSFNDPLDEAGMFNVI